jgi:drug/metabolite transporter (DMT)-like permease
MPTHVLVLVLFAALMHASWNAIVKSGRDKLEETALMGGASALMAACVLPFAGLPAAASWPWIITSVAIHQVYYLLVVAAYRAGDMGHTYPLMRGTAPLIVALASAEVLGETLTAPGWAGISLICGGILLLAIHRDANHRATLIAVTNAMVIAFYTVVDGTGVRLSGNAAGYVLCLNLLSNIPLFLVVWLRNRPKVEGMMRTNGLTATIGGACRLGAYGIALWAMTQAPVAAIAALRESSVLFGVVISMLILRENSGLLRIATALLIAAGAATLKLA